MERWLDIVLQFGLPTITGVVGWFAGRGKREQQVKSAELDNTEKIIALWREKAESAVQDIKDLKTELEPIRADYLKLMKEHARLLEWAEKELKNLRTENTRLRERIRKLEDKQ